MTFEEQMELLLRDYFADKETEDKATRAATALRLAETIGFTKGELESLKSVAAWYTAESEMFSRDEQRRLEFVRWLKETGRLEGDVGPA